MEALTAVFMGNQRLRVGGFIQGIHIVLQLRHMAVSLAPGIIIVLPVLQDGRIDSGNGFPVHEDLPGVREGAVGLPAFRHSLRTVRKAEIQVIPAVPFHHVRRPQQAVRPGHPVHDPFVCVLIRRSQRRPMVRPVLQIPGIRRIYMILVTAVFPSEHIL